MGCKDTHINIGKELANLIKDIIGFKGELYFNVDKPDGTTFFRKMGLKL